MDNYDEQAEETVVETEEEQAPELETTEETTEEEAEIDWKARALKAEQTIIKAKAKPKTETKPELTVNASQLSARDLIALSKANLDDEDIEEVMDYAGYKKLSIADALKSPVIQATIQRNAELKKSAAAVNLGSSKRAGGSVSDERLLADAQKGVYPESPEDIARLAVARFKNK